MSLRYAVGARGSLWSTSMDFPQKLPYCSQPRTSHLSELADAFGELRPLDEAGLDLVEAGTNGFDESLVHLRRMVLTTLKSELLAL